MTATAPPGPAARTAISTAVRRALLSLPFLAAALTQVPACDNTTEGQPAPDPGPPVLVKIMVQDESSSGGRGAATDLLDKAKPVACSLRDPCPVGDPYSQPRCDVDLGVCPDPLNPVQKPPAVGAPVNFGGNQFRLVFSKPLDPALFTPTFNPQTGALSGSVLNDPTIVGVYDDSGKELPAEKYWDPTGVPRDTSNIFTSPYGPALVVKPKLSLVPLNRYSVRIKKDQLRDAEGQPAAKDANGDDVMDQYAFTMEGLNAAGGASADLVDGKINPFGAIDVLDAYVIRSSARFDPASLKVTIEKDNQPVEIAYLPANINNPALCPASVGDSPTAIHIFRVRGEALIPWEVGTFTATIEAVSVDNRQAKFSADPFGKTPYERVPFTTLQNVDRDQLFLASKRNLPWQCVAARPTDMGVGYVPDLSATTPDAAVPDGG